MADDYRELEARLRACHVTPGPCEAADAIRDLRERLVSAIRAAELALFVINKQNVMPNSSWEGGFRKDLDFAKGNNAKNPPPAD